MIISTISFITLSILTDFNNWIEMHLAGGQNSPIAIAVIFLGGLTASLLPCVYPLYPITAGIISSRAKDGKIIHPLVYYFGLAFMYFIFGLMAAVSGGAFNQIMRLPATNLIIGLVVFVLGLAAIELIYIPFFQQHDFGEKQHGLKKTFLMGMGAGFLSSPCVGPVVVAILIQITAVTAENPSLEVILFSSLKMFIFGLGLGLPFILISIFHVKLPKSGKWMKSVEYILGILIFYFSYIFIEKGLTQLGYSSNQIYLIVIGFVGFVFAHYYYQKEATHQEKIKQSLLLAVMILAVIFIYKGVSISSTVSIPEKVSKIEEHGNLKWYRDREEAYQASRNTGKKIFIDFYADWCTNCKVFAEMTLTDKELNKALSNAILLKIYDTDSVFEEYAKEKGFEELNIGLPFFTILDMQGNIVFKTNNYEKKDEMIRYLEGKSGL